MQKKIYYFLRWLSCLVVLIILSAQSNNEINKTDQLPVKLSHEQDSLRQADDLAGWLYNYRVYVNDEPAKRIAVLSKAQSAAWRNAETDAEREEWFSCLTTQGYYFLFNGNILKSIDAYEAAYRFYFDRPLEGVDVLEYVLKPLGNNYTRLGDYDRAFFIQEKSLALAEVNDSSQIASICHNLATTAIWKEDLLLAKQYCLKGLARVSKNASLQGLLLSTLSEIYLKSEDIDSANINIRQAIAILSGHLGNKEEVNAAYWLRGAWQGLGDIQKAKNEPAAALQSYQKAIALIDKYYGGQRKREKAQLSVSTGRMLQQLQQPLQAIAQFNAALTLMIPSFSPKNFDDLPDTELLYGENTLLDALHGKAACLSVLNNKERAIACYMQLYAVDKKLRREFFSTTAKEQQQKENRQWAEAAMATAFELWTETANQQGPAATEYAGKILLIAEMSKAQLLLDEMRNSLRLKRVKNNDSLLSKGQQLIQAINFYGREMAMNAEKGRHDSNALATQKELQFELAMIQKQVKEKYPLQENLLAELQLPSVDSLLQSIEAGTTVIEFFAGEKNIYRIELETKKIIQIKKIERADTVLQNVENFADWYFQSGAANMLNNPAQYYKDAFALYKTLLQGSSATNNKNCIIIPDGVLGYIPFDALVTDSVYKPAIEQWPFLLKKTNLYFNYSLQTKLQQQKVMQASGSFAGFFISFDSSSQSAIPAVKKEYDEIHAVMNGRYFRDGKASLSAFTTQLEDVNLLHISTHSFLLGDNNMPVLQLADDRFFLFELYGKSFHPQLVVLSACRTGHGMLAKGEGIISLARGFSATGAAGIVAGLWDMNDEATATLMADFYKKLNKGQNPANALHDAKLQWLTEKNTGQIQKLPYYWAGMVYSGDNKPVALANRSSQRVWWLIMIGLIAAGLIFIIKKQGLLLK